MTVARSAEFCVLAVVPGAPTWGTITPGHVPGMLPWSALLPIEQSRLPARVPEARPQEAWTCLMPSPTNANRFWLIASLTAVVFLMLCLMARRIPWLFAARLSPPDQHQFARI